MKKLTLIAGFIVAVLLMPVMSQAMLVHIENPGFETDYLGDGSWQHSISGWTLEGIAGIYNPTDDKFSESIPEGENVGFTNDYASLYQELEYVLLPNTQLTLTVDVGWRLDHGSVLYEIDLLAGGNLLASTTNPELSQGGFVTSVTTYTVSDSNPLLGLPVAIRLSNTVSGSQVSFDNVSLTNDSLVGAVPEPSTLIGLGSGLMGLAFLRRKFKK